MKSGICNLKSPCQRCAQGAEKARGKNLTVPVQGVEALMGHGESRREVHPASDDLDVARRFARGGPGQRGVELTERGDSRREPAPTAQGGGQVMVVPGREVVVDPSGSASSARSTM
jgi:hypothetical protein